MFEKLLTETPSNRHCKFGKLLLTLDADSRVNLEAALALPAVLLDSRAIFLAVAAELPGAVGYSTLARHRIRECPCPVPATAGA